MWASLVGCVALVVVSADASSDGPVKTTWPGQETQSATRVSGPVKTSWDEQDAQQGVLGGEHEGEGLEVDVPVTIAEENVEGNHALRSVHGLAQNVVVPASVIFLICITFAGLRAASNKYVRAIPESAVTIIISMLLGFMLRGLMAEDIISLKHFTLVNAALLNLFLLPVIMFYSGWALQKTNFMSQFEYILIFAVFGTLISTFCIGVTSWWLANHLGLHVVTSWQGNMAFAALISAVDPVATLTSYSGLGIPRTQPLLNTMVFGESVINDAVAIVLFNTINMNWEGLSYGVAAWRMTSLLFGSILLGVAAAVLLVLLMRAARLGTTDHGAILAILFISSCAYFIFAVSESLHFSGIISGLFAGMIFGVYGQQNLTKEDRYLANQYLELSSSAADTGVFILCGTSTALITSFRGIKFGLCAIVLCLLARAVSVSTCGFACNMLKRAQNAGHILTWKHQVMMWHGGLRGGIALVLALQIDQNWCANKGVMINATFVVICFLLLTLGCTTEVLLDKLGMAAESGTDKEESEPILPHHGSSKELLFGSVFGSCDKFLTWALVSERKQPNEQDAA